MQPSSLAFAFWVDFYRFLVSLASGVFILNLDFEYFCEFAIKAEVKVGKIVLENERHIFGIRNNTFYFRFIIFQLNIANDWTKCLF